MMTQVARRELELAGLFDKDSAYGGLIGQAVMELMEVFAGQGHSGASAPIVAGIFKDLVGNEPLSPLTGADDEWMEVGTDQYQNNRCGAVFKAGKDAPAYYLDAITWKTQDGAHYGGPAELPGGGRISSRQFFDFPFVPKTFVIDVTEKAVDEYDYEFVINDPTQLTIVSEYGYRNEAGK